MDGPRFDDLTRLLAAGRSRRQVLTGIGASIAGFLGGAAGTDAQGCGRAGSGCGSRRRCCGSLTCLGGTCCPAALICGGACCPAGYTCRDDACSLAEGVPESVAPGGCPEGQARCNGVCTDISTIANCGACGNSCDDGNACTADACVNGACVQTPVVCAALDECHDVGTCDPATGLCSNPVKPFGSPCGQSARCDEDGVAHEQDFCDDDGACVPGEEIPCSENQECVDGACQSTCAELRDFCFADGDCCPGEGLECHIRTCSDTEVQLPRCCRVAGGFCEADCQCCPGFFCISGTCQPGCGSGPPCGTSLFDPRRVCCDGECRECCVTNDCVSVQGHHPHCVSCETFFDALICTVGQFHELPCDNGLGVCDEGDCRHCAAEGAECTSSADCCRGVCVEEGLVDHCRL